MKTYPPILGLTKKECSILSLLSKGVTSPTELASLSKVSRQGVYNILKTLKKRGLVESSKKKGLIHWALASQDQVAELFSLSEKSIFSTDASETDRKRSILVFTGKEGVHRVYGMIFKKYKDQEFITLQTKKSDMAWLLNFTKEEMVWYTSMASKSNLIHRNILEEGTIDNAFSLYGEAWAKTYIKRTAGTSELPSQYTNYASEIWISSNVVCLISVEEMTAVVITNKNFVKMLRSLILFIHERVHKIDVHSKLREYLQSKIK